MEKLYNRASSPLNMAPLLYGLAITNKGIEAIAAKEIEELIGTKGKAGITIVQYTINELLDLCALCYKAQSLARVLFLAGKLRFTSEEEIYEYAKTLDLSLFLTKDKTFAVRCIRMGEHGFDSADIGQGIGEILAKRYECKVNLTAPDIPVQVYIHADQCFIGVDFAGFDLSKRHYRIFAPSDTLRATTAYAMLRLAGFSAKTSLLDPFCNAGTILIEAALYACRHPVNYYGKDLFAFRRFPCFSDTDFDAFFGGLDKTIAFPKTKIIGYDTMLNHVAAAQKNAKIAGINKQIEVSKIDVEWLDTKFGKEELDLIATNPPIMTKINEKAIQKLYKELFYQAAFVLKKNGKMALVTPIPEAFMPFASEYKFKEASRTEIEQGKQKLWIVIFQR